jgi:hypothetical protein
MDAATKAMELEARSTWDRRLLLQAITEMQPETELSCRANRDRE